MVDLRFLRFLRFSDSLGTPVENAQSLLVTPLQAGSGEKEEAITS